MAGPPKPAFYPVVKSLKPDEPMLIFDPNGVGNKKPLIETGVSEAGEVLGYGGDAGGWISPRNAGSTCC